MLYKDFLKKLIDCPFCKDGQEYLFANSHAQLTYALAPYHKHHLLVTPKRHVSSIQEITKEEMKDIESLQKVALNILYKLGYDNVSFLVREGKSQSRTVDHIHFHIIPQINIGDLDHYGKERRILSDQEIIGVVEDIKKAITLL